MSLKRLNIILKRISTVIKHRDNKQKDQWLYYKPSHIERKEISDLKMSVDTVKIYRKSDAENNQY